MKYLILILLACSGCTSPTGATEGQERLLYREYARQTWHSYQTRNQGKAPSCVGTATAGAIEILDPLGDKPSAEAIYGYSRVEVGDVRYENGSFHKYAMRACKEYGILSEDTVGSYKSSRAVEWGKLGVPDHLDREAARRILVRYKKVTTYKQVRDALLNGYPVVIGSNVGFGTGRLVRDKDGFLNRPKRWFVQSKWKHAMFLLAVKDYDRAGALVQNSWGKTWISGPKLYGDEPEGSFWVDKKTIHDMVSQGDSYALIEVRNVRVY
jgi:hypothetical protein